MAQGLQVWDESGTLILDPSQRTVRIHGSRNTGTTAGSIVIDTSQGTPFYQAISRVSSVYRRPSFTLSGNTLSWTSSDAGCFFIWGTF